jgi:ABC-type transporter Mla maintaining outer membrane lipid asymmetry ATPase subunit MlaF
MNKAAANPLPPAVEMRGVAFGAMRDPSATVAEDVNWTVNAGEFWVVAGSQRSGKTDFLMLADGLLPPARGSYRFFNEAMPIFEDERLAERLRLGLVFDGGQLFNQMTIAENVALPLQYHRGLAFRDAGSRVQAMLELTELLPFANSPPASIARNWQKRGGLARALILGPDVLLLDNPLTGLDARHTSWWLAFLSRLSRGQSGLGDQPMTIIATADDLRPWRGHAQRVACLIGKRLLVLGDWSEADRRGEAAVRDLLNAGPAGN